MSTCFEWHNGEDIFVSSGVALITGLVALVVTAAVCPIDVGSLIVLRRANRHNSMGVSFYSLLVSCPSLKAGHILLSPLV